MLLGTLQSYYYRDGFFQQQDTWYPSAGETRRFQLIVVSMVFSLLHRIDCLKGFQFQDWTCGTHRKSSPAAPVWLLVQTQLAQTVAAVLPVAQRKKQCVRSQTQGCIRSLFALTAAPMATLAFFTDVSITCFYYMSLRTVIDPSLVGLTRIVVCCGRVKKRRSALA